MKLKSNILIGIDPGRNGGIAIINKGIYVKKMPETINELVDLLTDHKGAFVFLEKVQLWMADSKTQGKMFGISRMLKNYEMIVNALEITETPYLTIHPRTWNGAYKIYGREGKTERKRRYRHIAQQKFPEIKVTNWNADALLILEYGNMLAQTPYLLYTKVSENIKKMEIWR